MKKEKLILMAVIILVTTFSVSACQTRKGSLIEDKDASSRTKIKKLENPNVTVLTWNEPNEDSAKIFQDRYGGNVTFIQTSLGEGPTKLAAMVVAGDSPDIVIVRPDHMPRNAINNLLQPVEPYFDLKDPIFNAHTIEQFKYKDRYYAVCGNPGACRVVFFNETMFEDNGVKTPWQYYKEGNWNWNTFRELIKLFTRDTDGDGNIDQAGLSYNGSDKASFLIMNGGDLIEYTEDGIKVMLRDHKVIEALQFVQNVHFVDKAVMKTNDFLAGKVAMSIENRNFAKPGTKFDDFKYAWGIAPYPTGPSAPEGISFGVAAAWGIVNGAKNPEGGAAFIYTMTEYGQQKKEEEDENLSSYNDEQRALIKRLEEKIVFTKFEGIGNMKKVYNSMWTDITNKGLPIISVLEKYEPLIQAEVDLTLEGK